MFFDSALDDTNALSVIDPVLRDIAGWGAEVRRAGMAAADALAEIDRDDRPRAVVAGGPNGRLFRAVLEPICPVPFVAWPHTGLPGWAGPLDLVIVVCPGGVGEEELSAVAEARRRGCALLVAAPVDSPVYDAAQGRGTTFVPAGSLDPTAVAVPVLGALHRMGLGPETDAPAVADALDDVAERCGPGVPSDRNPAKELALVLADANPVVWGGSVLAARAARRVADALRSASGRPVVAGDDDQIVPLLQAAPEPDVFADPFEDGATAARPTLVILDDGAEESSGGPARARLEAAAEQGSVRVQQVRAVDGPGIGRFAALLATGRFAAAYLALGLGRPA
ncbi:phosphoglucose isomerase-like protein [Haloactinopolyspora alba]|uniref:Phosphoglucose isomerase-like protein n=1 Tax=Haloactinopolyspora alba TaxID=648780 RepID=A0A2P8D3A1_9ACTN|nr:SIS domain-containing protein [Haloactinopolyspora alba]PSK91704.1 phosphoglucose isomerase-like protein [Haloactinopolyspora alba]